MDLILIVKFIHHSNCQSVLENKESIPPRGFIHLWMKWKFSANACEELLEIFNRYKMLEPTISFYKRYRHVNRTPIKHTQFLYLKTLKSLFYFLLFWFFNFQSYTYPADFYWRRQFSPTFWSHNQEIFPSAAFVALGALKLTEGSWMKERFAACIGEKQT